MNLDNPNGWSAGKARRIPWLPTDATPGLDDLLDKAFGSPVPAGAPLATDERICEFLDYLNAGVRRISLDETDWASNVWVSYMERQPEYLGVVRVFGEPTELLLTGAVLVWCVETMAWEHAAGTTVALAGVR